MLVYLLGKNDYTLKSVFFVVVVVCHIKYEEADASADKL